MIPLNPNQSVANLKGDLGGQLESSYLNTVADATVYAKSRLTIPAFASVGQGDHLYFVTPLGTKVSVWFDKDADGTEPVAALHAAADVQIEVDVATGNSVAVMAAAAKAAIDAEEVVGVVVTDNEDGTLDIEFQKSGAITFSRHNSAEDGNGGLTVASVTAAVESPHQSKFVTLRSGADAAFYAWFNVDTLGADPSESGTGLEVALTSKMTAAQIATALAAVIDADAAFEAVADGPRVRITNAAKGDSTDITAGDSPMSVGGIVQGGAQRQLPSDSPANISNNPSAF